MTRPKGKMTYLENRVYIRLREAAEAGDPTPSIMSLAKELHSEACITSISQALARLVSSGRIKINSVAVGKRIVTITHTGESTAETRSRPLQDSTARPCLGCKKPFPSHGKGNRFCRRCKSRSGWQTDADFSLTPW